MKVLIIEDEPLAQNNLRNIIMKQFDNLEIVGMLSSVRSAIQWFENPLNHTDIVFLDVELSDGMCFDIFENIKTDAKIIITTAYDTYAIKAFKINSIDYLLKPIDPNELKCAIDRCKATSEKSNFDINMLKQAISSENSTNYKNRFVIRLGDKIMLLRTEDIAYFYAEDKSTYAVTFDNHRHILDLTLDATQEAINPRRFFRVSRSQIVSIDAIENISKHLNNRLKINLNPKPSFDTFVSRFRINDFMEWLEGK